MPGKNKPASDEPGQQTRLACYHRAVDRLLRNYCCSNFLIGEEIPIERCDVLPVIVAKAAGTDMRFLLDTGATTILNLRSFASGTSKEIRIDSWHGSAATSAREVMLPELQLGSHKLHDLKLPRLI